MSRAKRLAIATVASIGLIGMLAGPAAAGGDGGDGGGDGVKVGTRGPCSGESHYAALLTTRGRHVIRVGFKVKSGVAGEIWRVKIAHNRHLVLADLRRTDDEGAIVIRRPARNLEGRDHFWFKARNIATGEVCRARLVI